PPGAGLAGTSGRAQGGELREHRCDQRARRSRRLLRGLQAPRAGADPRQRAGLAGRGQRLLRDELLRHLRGRIRQAAALACLWRIHRIGHRRRDREYRDPGCRFLLGAGPAGQADGDGGELPGQLLAVAFCRVPGARAAGGPIGQIAGQRAPAIPGIRTMGGQVLAPERHLIGAVPLSAGGGNPAGDPSGWKFYRPRSIWYEILRGPRGPGMRDDDNLTIERPTFVTHLECSATGERHAADTLHNLSRAGKPLLVRYDLDGVKRALSREALALRPRDL